jgi:hypothetical protein
MPQATGIRAPRPDRASVTARSAGAAPRRARAHLSQELVVLAGRHQPGDRPDDREEQDDQQSRDLRQVPDGASCPQNAVRGG